MHGLCQEFLARQAAGRCDAWCHLRVSCGGEGLVEIIKVGPGSSDKWGPHNNSTYTHSANGLSLICLVIFHI